MNTGGRSGANCPNVAFFRGDQLSLIHLQPQNSATTTVVLMFLLFRGYVVSVQGRPSRSLNLDLTPTYWLLYFSQNTVIVYYIIFCDFPQVTTNIILLTTCRPWYSPQVIGHSHYSVLGAVVQYCSPKVSTRYKSRPSRVCYHYNIVIIGILFFLHFIRRAVHALIKTYQRRRIWPVRPRLLNIYSVPRGSGSRQCITITWCSTVSTLKSLKVRLVYGSPTTRSCKTSCYSTAF